MNKQKSNTVQSIIITAPDDGDVTDDAKTPKTPNTATNTPHDNIHHIEELRDNEHHDRYAIVSRLSVINTGSWRKKILEAQEKERDRKDGVSPSSTTKLQPVLDESKSNNNNTLSPFGVIDNLHNGQPVMATNLTGSKSNDIIHNVIREELKVNSNSNHIKKDKDDKPTNKSMFSGWFDASDDAFMYDEDWTDEFMNSKRVDYDRFNTLSEEINVGSTARKQLREFFDEYPSVTLFRNCQIAQYDNSFELAWKDVWQNLNDSLRRFHGSKYYKEWLQSNSANIMNVIPTQVRN